jgi:CMP/dCMP kinase
MKKKKKMEIITIDGPAGAGKSTVAKLLAKQLNFVYLDTGAMYRAVAVMAEKEGVDPHDEIALEQLCRKMNISFLEHDQGQRVICQGQDVTEKIREPKIGWLASTVSMKRPVREAMLHLQREIGRRGKVVVEGRDAGTVVFPEAEYKFFLIAQPAERAKRRFRELIGKGIPAKIEEVEEEVKRRDEQDSSRELAPLRPAADARMIDSTGLTPEEVATRMVEVMKKNQMEQAENSKRT